MSVDSPSPGSCTGHCCETFSLPMGPDALRKSYMLWISDNDAGTERADAPDGIVYEDIHLIYPMAVYVGKEEPPEACPDPGVSADVYLYKCKHFDWETRKCTIYSIRPAMCRNYPYGRPCPHTGCTFKPSASEALVAPVPEQP